jgi:hypothetical protein
MPDSPVVRFHYLKSNAYRVIHVDGIVGGQTPTGLLHFSFYTERLPIPTLVEHAATDLGGGQMRLGKEIRREGKDGIVRDVEVGVIMTVDMAMKLRGWLDDKISKLTEVHEAGASIDTTGDT